ncbi:MAG TPA: vitamin B12 dependent-methionine synthase activation domain-containing protein [Thermoanaerobaculia bacterium]|nr:vitamin B12 dependent-methionine synthase activation domain-containing protein [Thermoanaerobaculia bacterium]
MIPLRFMELRPAEGDVLRRLGVPAGAEVRPELRELLDRAAEKAENLVEARGVIHPVAREEFVAIYEGEGKNAPESPLEKIYARASALALFVATLGDKLERELSTLFREGDSALAVVLDAYASSMMNRAVDALVKRFEFEFFDDRLRVLPYSPGYCGWHLTGQRALFGTLEFDNAGVTLGENCLMIPLKSVSGVLVAGEPAVHHFRPDFEFCEECDAHTCIPRMASVNR